MFRTSFAWFVVFGSLLLPSTRQPRAILAPIVPHCRIGHNGEAAMPASMFPARMATDSGLRGSRRGADCRSGRLCLECRHMGNGELPLRGESMMSKSARAVVVVGASCLISVVAVTAPSHGADDATSVWQGV